MDKDLSSLRKQKGFVPLLIAQIGGALNDNLFRSALLILISFELTASGNNQSTSNIALLSNLALVLFLMPMILFSPLAGQLADRFDKSLMMQKNKIAEILICVLATIAFALDALFLMYLTLFLLGAQSAMFGPNKYAYLPQILPHRLVLKGNAIVAAGTFIAITIGVLLGALLAALEQFWLIAGPCMILIALIGYWATRALPQVPVGVPRLSFDPNIWRQARQGMQFARTDHQTWISILGISWFWAIGSIYLTQLPMYTGYTLRGDAIVAAILVSCFIFGLLSGAYFCTRTQFSRTEPGLIPTGLMGLLFSGLAFAQFSIPADSLQSAGQVFTQAAGLGAAFSVFLIGMFGGLFVVPQYALLQQRTELSFRARVVAANNLLNALFMIIACLASIVFLGLLQWSLKPYLTLCALFCLPILIMQMKELSHEFWRLVGYVLARTAYRVKILDKDKIPESGPVLLVCNHISYADAVVLFGSIDRRTRFVMEDIYHRIPVLNWAFRGARTIPISSPLKNRKKFEDAEISTVEALRSGEMVFIFPEGRLSPAGEIIPFKRGVMRILEQQPVTIVPVAIKGLWGSYFSHGGGKPALKGFPKLGLKRRLVTVKFGDPLEGSKTTLESMQRKVAELHAQI